MGNDEKAKKGVDCGYDSCENPLTNGDLKKNGFCENHTCSNPYCFYKYHYNRIIPSFAKKMKEKDFCSSCEEKNNIPQKCMVLNCQNSGENKIYFKIKKGSNQITINACNFHTCKNKYDPFSKEDSDGSTRFHINDLRIGINSNENNETDRCYCTFCRCRNKNCEKDNEKPKQNFFSKNIKRIPIELKNNYFIYYCSEECFKEDKEFKFGPLFKDKIFTTETNCNIDGNLGFNKNERKFILSSLNKLNKFMLDEEEKKEAEARKEEAKKKEEEAKKKGTLEDNNDV